MSVGRQGGLVVCGAKVWGGDRHASERATLQPRLLPRTSTCQHSTNHEQPPALRLPPAKPSTAFNPLARSSPSIDLVSTPVYEPEPAPPSPPQQDLPPPKPARKSAAMPARRTSTDDEFNTWFAQFADEDEPDKMAHEGIEALFDQMGLDMNGVSTVQACVCRRSFHQVVGKVWSQFGRFKGGC